MKTTFFATALALAGMVSAVPNIPSYSSPPSYGGGQPKSPSQPGQPKPPSYGGGQPKSPSQPGQPKPPSYGGGQPKPPYHSPSPPTSPIQPGQPGHPGQCGYCPPGCISQQEGEEWLQEFIGVLGQTDPNLQSTAERILADNFKEYSNSILSLQALPLGTPGISAPTKEDWIQGIIHAPQDKGIQTLEVLVTCNRILWYWVFTGVGSAQYPVTGFNLFHMKRKGAQLQVEALYLEFDSIAWGLDTGIKVTYPNGTMLPSGGK